MAQTNMRPRRRRGESAPARRSSEDRQRPPEERQRFFDGRQRSSNNRQRSVSRQGPRMPRNDDRDNSSRKQPLWEKYGVPRGRCLQCSGNHRINDPACDYKNTGLPESACKYPGCMESGTGGGHWSYLCKTRAHTNASSNPPPPPQGQSSRGRTSRGSRGREKSSRGGKSSAARRLNYPDAALQVREQPSNEEDGAFYFEE